MKTRSAKNKGKRLQNSVRDILLETFKEQLEDFKAQKQEEDQKEQERLGFLEEQERKMEAEKWHGIIMKKVKRLS